jgi:hypothetical protein
MSRDPAKPPPRRNPLLGRALFAGLVFAVGLALPAASGLVDPARAGSVRPGGTRTARLDDKPKLARRLVGRWRLVSILRNGKTTHLPQRFVIHFELKADGTAVVYRKGSKQPMKRLGRWSVQGKYLVFQKRRKGRPPRTGKASSRSKAQKVRFWLKGDTLTFENPGSQKNMRMRLRRDPKPGGQRP